MSSVLLILGTDFHETILHKNRGLVSGIGCSCVEATVPGLAFSGACQTLRPHVKALQASSVGYFTHACFEPQVCSPMAKPMHVQPMPAARIAHSICLANSKCTFATIAAQECYLFSERGKAVQLVLRYESPPAARVAHCFCCPVSFIFLQLL